MKDAILRFLKGIGLIRRKHTDPAFIGLEFPPDDEPDKPSEVQWLIDHYDQIKWPEL